MEIEHPDIATETVLSFFTVIRRLAQADGRHGQHPKAWPLLGRLTHTSSMRVSDLADFAGLDASTVSRHVKALEDDGLVARDTDPDDRRAASVRITDEGRAFIQEAITVRGRLMADATHDWTPEERELLAGLMRRLAVALDPNAPAAPTPTESTS